MATSIAATIVVAIIFTTNYNNSSHSLPMSFFRFAKSHLRGQQWKQFTLYRPHEFRWKNLAPYSTRLIQTPLLQLYPSLTQPLLPGLSSPQNQPQKEAVPLPRPLLWLPSVGPLPGIRQLPQDDCPLAASSPSPQQSEAPRSPHLLLPCREGSLSCRGRRSPFPGPRTTLIA